MSDPFEPLHQPPNPADLRRHPPRNPHCARVYSLLRDFADGDLDTPLSGEVEQHVHECRACGLALSRAEHEVLRMRRGFGGELAQGAQAVQPAAGFARRTVERLLVESARTEQAGTRAVAGASRARPDRLRRSLSWAVALGMSAAATAFASFAFWQQQVRLTSPARFSVVQANDAFSREGANMVRLAPGQGLGEDAVIVITANGSAVIDASDGTAGTQPAAQITLRGDADLRMRAGSPLLVDGTMEVKSYRPMLVNLTDGARAEVGTGLYHFDVQQERSFDQVASAAEAEFGVRLEVLDGEAARLVRKQDGGEKTIVVGQVGRYRGFGAMTVEAVPDATTVAGAIGQGPRQTVPPVEPTPDFIGYVYVRPHGTYAAGIRVDLRYLRNQQGQNQGLTRAGLLSDGDGRFDLAPGSGLTGSFVVVQMAPPVGVTDLGLSVPDAYPLVPNGTGYTLPQTLPLDPSPPITGSVFDSVGNARMGVRLVPCLYDEIFGLLLPWVEAAVSSDASGTFVLRGLPTSLPRHQTLGVVALHPELQLTFTPLPLPGSVAQSALQLRIVLQSLHEVNLLNLQHGVDCEIDEELAGLPGSGLFQRPPVRANNAGQGQVRVGNGRLWLRSGPASRPQLRLLTLIGGSYRPADPPVDLAAQFRPLTAVPGTGFWLAHEFRHQSFRELRPETAELLVIDHATGRFVTQVQVFAVRQAPGGGLHPRFLGIQDQPGSLHFDVDPGEQELVAIGSDGALARCNLQELFSSGRAAPIQLNAPGSAIVGEQLRPASGVLLLKFEPLGPGVLGARPPLYRFATAAEGWVLPGIPSGDYTVRDPQGHAFHVTVLPDRQSQIR